MTEAGFWTSLRNAVKGDLGSVWWKVQDQYRKGLPDVVFRVRRVAGFMELKYVPQAPVRETTNVWVKVTPNQMRHLREWQGVTTLAEVWGDPPPGNAYILLGVDRTWYLLSPMWVDQWARNGDRLPGATLSVIESEALVQGTIGQWDPLLDFLA